MSFELTFDSKSSTALAVCVLLLCALIAVAGFLLGARHARLALMPAHVAVPAPALPQIPKKTALPSLSAASSRQQGSNASGVAVPTQLQPAAIALQPGSAATASYVLQFGLFAEQAHAAALVKELKEKSISSSISTEPSSTGASYYVVRSGSYPTLQSAVDAARTIHAQTGETVFVRHSRSL